MLAARPVRIAVSALLAILVAGCSGSGGGRDGAPAPRVPLAGRLAFDGSLALWGLYALSIPLEAINQQRGWERTDLDKNLPWIAPGKRVEAWVRRDIPDLADLEGAEYRWSVGGQLVYPFDAFNPRISSFILGDPVSRGWEVGWSYGNEAWSAESVLADYAFHLVSVEPMLVVMAPYAKHRRSPHGGGARRKPDARGYIIPYEEIHYATSFAGAEGLLWFSPDLGRPAQPLPFDATNIARLQLGDHEFACARSARRTGCIRKTGEST
jgi:hypothetical protein